MVHRRQFRSNALHFVRDPAVLDAAVFDDDVRRRTPPSRDRLTLPLLTTVAVAPGATIPPAMRPATTTFAAHTALNWAAGARTQEPST